MRLADWDAATVAHYRRLWERANKAHEVLPPQSVASGFLALLMDAPELAEVVDLTEEELDARLAEAESEVEAFEARIEQAAGTDVDLLKEVTSARILRNKLKKVRRLRRSDDPEARRWRVRYALAALLSTQPALLPPEQALRRAVRAHCESIGYTLPPHRGRAGGADESRSLPAPPEDGLRSVWERVDDAATRLEAKYGRIERLAPFLDLLRAEDERSGELLMELWTEAVALVEREPANPVTAGLLAHFDGERNRAVSYRQFKLPKRRGGTRMITTPRKRLKWVQRSLLQVLTHLFPRHKCAMGFERGESVVSHAKAHAGKRWVYVVDIENFFPSITRNRVYGMLRAKPFVASEPVARYLANLATHDGALPQGAPTSPILANLLCRRMDARLFKWAREREYQYTRYADDLAFSTNRAEFSKEDRAMIREIIEDEGFRVHPEKQKLMPWYGRQLVTGLVVNEKPNVPRSTVRGLRALLRNVEKHGWKSQVHRDQAFGDADAWMAYKRRTLPVEAYRKVVARQRENHLLIRPGTAIRKAKEASDPVRMLQRVVRGRIEFVGAVRGKRDPVYLRLREQYDRLVARNRATKAAVHAGRRSFVPEKVEVPAEAQGNYAEAKALLARVQDGDADASDIYRWVEAQASWALEAEWLLREFSDLDADELAKRVRALAYKLDTHPERTAAFFRQFQLERPYRQLLHDPLTEPDAEGRFHFGDGSERTLLALVGACLKALREPLPNPLKKETRKVLNACQEWLEVHPNEHPYLAAPLHERLETYKWEMRYENEPGHSLYERIGGVVAKLREKGAVIEFDESAAPAEFYTYTPSITGQRPREGLPPKPGALVRLLHSLAEKAIRKQVDGVVQPIRISTWYGEVAGQRQAAIYLQAHDGPVQKEKGIRPILSGDTQRVLPDLRGFAFWTMEVPYPDGSVHAYDVTTNTHVGEVAQPLPGFRHILRFYQ